MILIIVLLNLFMAYQLYKIRHIPQVFPAPNFYVNLILFCVVINVIVFFAILSLLSLVELVVHATGL